jgi:hypothetical protein
MPLSMPLVIILNWAQRACWRLGCDAPSQLAGFVLNVRYVYVPRFSQQSGCRIVLEGLDSLAEVKRLVFKRSSETLNEAIVNSEIARLENFKRELGFAHKVTPLKLIIHKTYRSRSANIQRMERTKKS